MEIQIVTPRQLRRNPSELDGKSISLIARLVPNLTTYSYHQRDDKSKDSTDFHLYRGSLDLGYRTILRFEYGVPTSFPDFFDFDCLKASEGSFITVTGDFTYRPKDPIMTHINIKPSFHDRHKIEVPWKHL